MVEKPSSIGRRRFIKSTAVGGGTILGGIAATDLVAAYDDVSWPLKDSEYTFKDGRNERYRSISRMTLDYYIEWNSSGHFQHKPIINTAHEANRQDGTNAYGDPTYTTEGWIMESRLNVNTKSDGWRLSDRENNYLECCPGIAGENDYSPNEFFKWSVDFLLSNTPGISTLKDIFEGGSALVQTLYDEKEDDYTTSYKWDYDNSNSGQLRDGESYPYTDSQSFQPAEEVDHSTYSSNRSAEAVFQTTWDHKGGAGAPDAPVAGFDIEVPTPDKRFDEMTSSEKDEWGVKPAGESRFPLTGTDDDDLIATDPPANVTFLSY